ncbi:aldehyde dehydrogenase [Paenibacillus gansuensis]|uniref:Aldehyde dehydrogenase n=1 Tax=Paenibacillus gansuensis TaxID=306542 RepID=A0ABW5PB77_9BACL
MSISEVVQRQRDYYASGRTRDIRQRLAHLETLRSGILRYEPMILEALQKDLNKIGLEAYMTEIGFLLEEIKFTMKHLRKWAKPKRVKTAMTHFGSKGRIVPEPYGTALIIAPWNYPFQLALAPVIGAIAAGNTVVLKPSELTPAVSAVLKSMVHELYGNPDFMAVVEGGAETSTELLEQKFDYIFFTGSVPVGKIVMEAAAKQLIPLTLELGGKSPCIVHHDADLKLAARRIAFGKFTNAGQTCIAPDYLFVHEDIHNAFREQFTACIREFYGENPLNNPNYVRIVSERHFNRLVSFIEQGSVTAGGTSDKEKLTIAPTLLENVSWEAPVMQEEIFGPILPVFPYRDLNDVIQRVNSRPKPLALYLFTVNNDVQNEIIKRVPFGGGSINDTLMHIATPYLPFGGVGESGMGSYHGESSFRAFSHYKSVLKQTNRFDLSFRYPSAKNGLAIMKRLLK